MGKYVNTSGATGNKAKRGAATRVANQRNVADLLEKAPPMKNKAEYNGGMGKAALSTEDWLNGLAPAKKAVDTGHPSWDLEIAGYDWSCGMQGGEWASDAIIGAPSWNTGIELTNQIIDYLMPATVRPLEDDLPKRPISFTEDETKLIKAITPLFECHIAAYVSGDRTSLRNEFKEARVMFRDAYHHSTKPEPATPEQVAQLQAPVEPPSKFEARPEQSDDLYTALDNVVRHYEDRKGTKLPLGFYIEEEKNSLYIKHFGMPKLKRLVGAKLASGAYGITIQKGEVGQLIVQLLEANKAKQAKPKTGPTPIGEMVQAVTERVTKDVTPSQPKRDTDKNMVKVGSDMVAGL